MLEINGVTINIPPEMQGGPGIAEGWDCDWWTLQMGMSWVSFCADTGELVASHMEGPSAKAFDKLLEALERRP